MASAEEAPISVFGNQGKKALDRADLRRRWIGMPFQVGPLPEHLPESARADVCGLGNAVLLLFTGRAAPSWAHLEDLDALSRHAIRKVQLGADVGHWSALFDECTHHLLKTPDFELGKGHAVGDRGSDR
jgi:hypothetical protein